MKGIVFNEFFGLVDETFGPNMTETIIVDAELPNEGGYTGVGHYDAAEMQSLVGHLSARTEVPVRDLLLAFGKYLLKSFSRNHANYFQSCSDIFQFAQAVEQQIHVDVLKLYPDAELPRLAPTLESETRLSLLYRSSRHMADLAEGLLLGAIEHYGDTVDLERTDLPDEDGDQVARFTLRRK